MLIDQYREAEFTATVNNGIFLNHAASSPMPARVARAITDAMTTSSTNPEQYFMEHILPALKSLHDRFAALTGVEQDNIALMRNTSQGLSVIADGLALEPGDNVVMASCEYPSVVYPWYAQSWRGVETRLVPAASDGTFSVDDFAPYIDSRTRVLALSWVQFATGYRADLEQFAELAKAHNLLFVLDAIQALGVIPFDAKALGIDVVVTGSQKWLLGPHGTGALYIKPDILDRLHLVNMGACSVVDVIKFDPLDFSVKGTAQRYEEGTPNGLGAIGCDKAIEILQQVGIENVQSRVFDLTRHAIDALDRKGYRVQSPREDHRRAGIVLFDHPDRPSEDLLTEMKQKARVGASIRNGRVRLSPHFYNTLEEIDTAIDALP
jgi:selenocysteine lyase/cysteine desulfurase